jgi:MscS family membrane protein
MVRRIIGLLGVSILVLVVIAAPRAYAQEIGISPLAPPDTSSPRATLESFRANTETAFRGRYEGQDEMLPFERQALARAIACLDTSQLPPVRARRVAVESTLILIDLLGRVPIPPYAEVPDALAMAELPPGVARNWRIPGTEIEISKITEGPSAGQYLFSAETVARVREFYLLAQNMPYKAGAMDGFYERFTNEPGPWIPVKWTRALPGWAHESVGGQAVWKWIAMVITAGAWLLLVMLAYRVTHRKGEKPRYWVRFVLALILLPVTAAFREFFDTQLLIVGPAYGVVDSIVVVLFFVIGAVAVLNLGAAIASTIVSSPRFETRILDANFITVACHSIAWLCAIVILAKGASDLGVPIAAVIASLGVGGVAFALAARPTLENLIAGVTLYLDKPIKVGQFCQFQEVLGTVERIGLRSIRIRRWGGNLLSIPNAQFAEYQLDNYNDARYIWIRERLRLRYETTPEQLQYILAKIREMLFAHPKILAPRARLIGFGEDALTVEVLCYTDTGVWAEWHAIREDVLLRLMEIIETAGTRLALPSKTMYYARDVGLDEERKRAAEEQVNDWTEAGELPFPDMSEEQREALTGTLAFPPEGSVQHNVAEKKD